MAGLPTSVHVTGDYRRARPWDAPGVAWMVGRAFATRLPPWIPGHVWNVLLWPGRLMGLAVVWMAGGVVLVAPAGGRPRASVALAVPMSWSLRVAARMLAVFTVLVVTMTVLALVVGLGVVAVLAGVECTLLVADQRLMVRNRPPGGGRQPAADVVVGQLAAWPMGHGQGPALMAAAVEDLDGSWPGAVLCLQPANERVAGLYEGLGFRFAPGSGWMVRECGVGDRQEGHRQTP